MGVSARHSAQAMLTCELSLYAYGPTDLQCSQPPLGCAHVSFQWSVFSRVIANLLPNRELKSTANAFDSLSLSRNRTNPPRTTTNPGYLEFCSLVLLVSRPDRPNHHHNELECSSHPQCTLNTNLTMGPSTTHDRAHQQQQRCSHPTVPLRILCETSKKFSIHEQITIYACQHHTCQAVELQGPADYCLTGTLECDQTYRQQDVPLDRCRSP